MQREKRFLDIKGIDILRTGIGGRAERAIGKDAFPGMMGTGAPPAAVTPGMVTGVPA